jgi:mycothiol synthase
MLRCERVQIEELGRDHLDAARALLEAALPFDRVAVVAEEKLFGGNAARSGATLGAWDGDALVGVAATAGRWLKLVAVDARARRRGVGTALVRLAAARGVKLRVGDHPGNYLSPGVDARYEAAAAFFADLGFRALDPIDNLRAPLDRNPLVTEARARELARACAPYELRRARPSDLHALDAHLPPAQRYEIARAQAGPRHAVHVALLKGAPVAVAAADGNNQGLGWFGPEWTHPDHRGRGLGRALLIPCLLDVRGLPDAGVIAWVGPKEFYAKSCGARDDRRFVPWEQP